MGTHIASQPGQGGTVQRHRTAAADSRAAGADGQPTALRRSPAERPARALPDATAAGVRRRPRDGTTGSPPAAADQARIIRLAVEAAPDDSELAVPEAMRRARDGDESWREWVARLNDGEAVVVRLRTRVEFELDGAVDAVEVANHGVWIDRDVHVPKVEEQVREIAYKDVRSLHDALCDHGVDITEDELSLMFFHVQLSGELAAMCRAGTGA